MGLNSLDTLVITMIAVTVVGVFFGHAAQKWLLRRWRDRKAAKRAALLAQAGRHPPTPACQEEIVFDFLGENSKRVLHMVHLHSRWIGAHEMPCRLLTPGDGTVRYRFERITDAVHFKLRWYGQDE